MQQIRDNKTDRIKHVTSIGNSPRSTPKNKNKISCSKSSREDLSISICKILRKSTICIIVLLPPQILFLPTFQDFSKFFIKSFQWFAVFAIVSFSAWAVAASFLESHSAFETPFGFTTFSLFFDLSPTVHLYFFKR